jgi:hypothetical protein
MLSATCRCLPSFPEVGRAAYDVTDAVPVERLQESKLRRPNWPAKTTVGIQPATTRIVWNETFNRRERLHVPNNFSDEDFLGCVRQGDSATLPASCPDIALLGEIVYDFHQVAFRDAMGARNLRNRGVQALSLRQVNQRSQ